MTRDEFIGKYVAESGRGEAMRDLESLFEVQAEIQRTIWLKALAKEEALGNEARAKCAEWEEKAKAWMASPKAAARLDGYRELADRIAVLERELDRRVRQGDANEAKLHEALGWARKWRRDLPVASPATLEVVDRLRRAERERDESRAEASEWKTRATMLSEREADTP